MKIITQPDNNCDTNEFSQSTLQESVHTALDKFFTQLEGQPVTDLYDMVISQVEEPLLRVVMHHAKDNQSKASEMLGINRGTLRKKLKQYNLLKG